MPRRNKNTNHAPFQFVSHTDGKRRYASEFEAKRAAEIQMLASPNLELYVYRAENGGWYLTRTPPTK